MPDGVTTAVWQGREGTKLGTDEPMCRNLEAVKAALKIGAEIEETVCKHKEARCPFYDTCHYQAQKAPAKKADVVFAAHEILFQDDQALGKGFGLVVVDEGFWQDGITGTRLAIAGLDHELKAFPVRDKGVSEVDKLRPTHLRELIEQLQAALEAMPDGYVTRQPLIDAGLMPQRLSIRTVRVRSRASSNGSARSKPECRPKPATKNGRKPSNSSASSGKYPRAQRCGGRWTT